MSEPRDVCWTCFKPRVVCVCATIVRVPNRTHVHILQHPRERNFPIGTVRFARLGLQRCTVEESAPRSGVPSRLAANPPPGAALLFPSPDARPVESLAPADRPSTLIVVDGTWQQVKALVRNNQWLQDLPHVFLASPPPSRYRIRAEPKIHYLSTLEAIAATLAWLEPDTPGYDGLLAAMDAMIDVQIARAAHPNPRRPASRRAPDDGPPVWLATTRARHVLLHVETIGPRGARRPLHACAWRVSTDERFEGLVAHPDGRDRDKRAHLGLSEAAFAGAIREEQLTEALRGFLRPDDVLLAWDRRALEAIGAADAGRLLKAVWCSRTHRPAGHLADIVTGLGLAPPEAPFAGRSASQLGLLRGLLDWMVGGAPLRPMPAER